MGAGKCPKMSDIGIQETHLAKNIQSVHIHHHEYYTITMIIEITMIIIEITMIITITKNTTIITIIMIITVVILPVWTMIITIIMIITDVNQPVFLAVEMKPLNPIHLSKRLAWVCFDGFFILL